MINQNFNLKINFLFQIGRLCRVCMAFGIKKVGQTYQLGLFRPLWFGGLEFSQRLPLCVS